jgi:hypothetical protein
VDPVTFKLASEDPGTAPDELLDTPCDSTTDSTVVEVVGFVPGTPAKPLVRVTIGFVLLDDDEDWPLARDDEDWLLSDEDCSSTATAPALVDTLDDETTEEDLAPTAPLVLVILVDTDVDVDNAELDCAIETLVETFEEELAAFDDELFGAEEET